MVGPVVCEVNLYEGWRLRWVGSLRDGRWGLGEGRLEGRAYGRWNL